MFRADNPFQCQCEITHDMNFTERTYVGVVAVMVSQKPRERICRKKREEKKRKGKERKKESVPSSSPTSVPAYLCCSGVIQSRDVRRGRVCAMIIFINSVPWPFHFMLAFYFSLRTVGCDVTHPATSRTISRTKAVRLLRWPLVREMRGLLSRGVTFCFIGMN